MSTWGHHPARTQRSKRISALYLVVRPEVRPKGSWVGAMESQIVPRDRLEPSKTRVCVLSPSQTNERLRRKITLSVSLTQYCHGSDPWRYDLRETCELHETE